METWFIGPAIGAAGVALAWVRGRQMNRRLADSQAQLVEANERLARLEEAVTRRPIEQPETIIRKRAPDIGIALASEEAREALGEAIARLPEREKLATVLFYYEGLSHREIGDVLGLTEQTVAQLLQRAVIRLKARLHEDGFDV